MFCEIVSLAKEHFSPRIDTTGDAPMLSTLSGGQTTLWPTRSSARVIVYGGEQSGVDRAALRFFGRTLHPWEYAGLCGAPDDVVVEVGTLGRGLCLEFYQPHYFSYVGMRLVRWARGRLTLVDEGLHIHDNRLRCRRLGLQMFRRQLCHARRLGIIQICTVAGRRSDENGYYTWPRYGFDGPLPRRVQRELPPPLRHARRILDLMSTEPGRCWWREYGTTLELTFDLAPASRSSQTFRRYLVEKLFGND